MMAGNSWNETMADVNKTLTNMNTAVSGANGAAEQARNSAEEADAQAAAAEAAAAAADDAAAAANEEAAKWKEAVFSAVTLPAGSEATVNLSEEDGAKRITIGVPRGADGRDGPKGDTGRSGVTFTRSGSTLYIVTD